jgi:hypothetical protein
VPPFLNSFLLVPFLIFSSIRSFSGFLLLPFLFYFTIILIIPEGKRPLGRSRRRWEDNIKMDLQEVGVGGVDLVELAQDRDRWRALVSTAKNFRVP